MADEIKAAGKIKAGGKKIRMGQAVRQVTVDAGLLPKVAGAPTSKAAGGKAAGGKAAEGKAAEGKARVSVVSPVTPAVLAMRKSMKQQSAKAKVAKVTAAIEAGSVPAAEAKALVLAHLAKIAGTSAVAEKLYRSQHLEAFGGRTPAQLVRAGELRALLVHLSAAMPATKA
ncbi:hypothetical protein PDO_3708 [Rhizobium sp. PDO1-076]|uniref:hypothetical protein n=1 Tax=Rhizobium sp. PDO1-076 TaxID=1125979 RepID=UPI00024E2C74|nr:hypothetical protein [Rhizobium sp. PDO1-076]EHS54177.1 hypothetical protein PDO_3708 [Rhizobium sp. PDO1-076]